MMQGLQHGGNPAGYLPSTHAKLAPNSIKHARPAAACCSLNQGRVGATTAQSVQQHTTHVPSHGHNASALRGGSSSSLDAARAVTADSALSLEDRLQGLLGDQLVLARQDGSMQHQLSVDELDMHYSLQADGHNQLSNTQVFTSHHNVALWPSSNGSQQAPAQQSHQAAVRVLHDFNTQGESSTLQHSTHAAPSQRVHRRQGAHRRAPGPRPALTQSPQQVPQPAQGSTQHTHVIEPRLLTKQLSLCRSFHELQSLCTQHINSFNHFHVACALNRLVKCCPNPSQQANAAAAQQLHKDLEMLFVHHLPQYTAREVANAVWGWSTSEHAPSDSTRQLIISAITARDAELLRAAHVTPQALANLACGLAKLGWQDKGLWTQLTAAVASALQHHTQQQQRGKQAHANISHAHRQRHKAGPKYNSNGRDRQAVQQNTHGIRFAPYDLASLAWSYATAKQYRAELFHMIVDASLADLTEFCAIDLVNLLWACATVQHPSAKLFRAAAPLVLECADGLTVQGLANTAWAYAASGQHNSQVLDTICRHAMLQTSQMLPMHFAQLTWALMKAHQVQPHFMRAALGSAVAQPDRWRTKDLSLLLYSVTSLGMMDEEAFQHLTPVFLQRLQAAQQAGSVVRTGPTKGRHHQHSSGRTSLYFQDISQIAWSHAKANGYDAELFNVMAELCIAHKDAWIASPEAFQSVIWAFGYARHYNETMFKLAADHLATSLSPTTKLSPSQVAGMVVPLAAIQHHDSAAFAAAARHFTWLCTQQPGGVNTETLTNVLWSLAMVDHVDLPFLEAALSTLAGRWEEQCRSMMYWQADNARSGAANDMDGYDSSDEHDDWAIAGVDSMIHSSMADEQEAAAIATMPHTALRSKQLGQLFQVVMWLQEHASPDVSGLPTRLLPANLLSHAKETWLEQAYKGRVVSGFQADVYQSLCSLGLPVQLEQLSSDQLFSLDCILTVGSQKVAVEANGPVHYDKSSPPRLLGSKALRDRLLASRGYAVLNVAYWEWEALNEDREAMRSFLIDRLSGVVGQAGRQVLQKVELDMHTSS